MMAAFFFAPFEVWRRVLDERLLDYAGVVAGDLPIPVRTLRIWWLYGASAQWTADVLAGFVQRVKGA